MALKRRINYQFRLFIPIVGMLWLVIIGFSLILVEREKTYKTEYLRSRVDILNSRLIDLYENNDDPTHYLEFIEDYFASSALDNLSMTVYDTQTGDIIKHIGFPAPTPTELTNSSGRMLGSFLADNLSVTDGADQISLDPKKAFYYNVATTSDGAIMVQTLLPYDSVLISEIQGSALWWIFVIASCLLVGVVTYFATKHLAMNVKLLRDFAVSAANDDDFVVLDKFNDDELGEISTQIIHIYTMRKAADASKEIEHKVALKATEERNALKRQMTDNINHELKTPAAVIKGYVDTIIANPDMDADARSHFMLKIRDHVDRLCSILNDISTMTRLDEASSKIEIQEINFHDFVARLAEEIDESAIAGDMTFKYSIPGDCLVKGNATLLTGALMNLVKNAVAYSKGTEMGIRYLSRNARFYTFVFYDNGDGVGEEHLPMLFERFYRVDKGRSRKMGGTGLGLPIVRSSFNTIGGSVSVRNGEECGLEFVFTLAAATAKVTPSDETL